MIKKFDEFINEAVLNEAKNNFKKYKDVKINDEGEDYNGEKGKVTNIGTAEEIVKKDPNGVMVSLIKDGTIDPKQDAVLCTMEDGIDVAYVYGDDGFQCYK